LLFAFICAAAPTASPLLFAAARLKLLNEVPWLTLQSYLSAVRSFGDVNILE
jgi:hypothetical protein